MIAIGQLAGAGEIAFALRDFDFLTRLVEPLLEALHVLDGLLFFLPFGGERGRLFFQLG